MSDTISDVSDIFVRNVPGTAAVLKNRCVGVAGCGGLGSNAALLLARAGVGKLIIADFDRVEQSNLNRQCFFQQDVGELKVDALSRYLLSINPELSVESHSVRIDEINMSNIFAGADILVEAFDLASSKKFLIQSWCRNFPQRHIICGNGMSGLGSLDKIGMEHMGMVHFCGDCTSDFTMGLCSARVAYVAAMQAYLAIELLLS